VVHSFAFISPAYAQAPAGPGGMDIMSFAPMLLILVVFYFLLIRPQQKRAKETRSMLAALAKGDEVVTAGGVLGRITKLDDAYATIEVAPNVQITVQRSAVSLLLPKGTLKAL
jgi:preprotein translocase subunit YajC